MRLSKEPLLGALAAGALLAATVLSWWILRREEDGTRSEEEMRLVSAVSATLTAGVQDVAAGLVGADTVVDADGRLASNRFDRFAKALLEQTRASGVAFNERVPADERQAFESRIEHPITDAAGGGSFSPAPVRDLYCPITTVRSADASTTSVIGFDACGEPARRAIYDAAAATGTTVLSPPVIGARTGKPAVVLVHAVTRPGPDPSAADGPVIGWVTAGYELDDLVLPAIRQLPAATRFSITDGSDVVARSSRPPSGGSRSDLEVGGRGWALMVDEPGAGHRASWSLLALGGVLAATLYAGFRRSRRATQAQEELLRSRQLEAERNERLAGFAQALACAASTEEVLRDVAETVAGVLEGSFAAIGLVEPGAPDELRVLTGSALSSDLASRYAVIPLDAANPMAEVARTNRPVVIEDGVQYRSRYPAMSEDIRASETSGSVILPVRGRGGLAIGALGVAWSHPLEEPEAQLTRATTVAELVGQTLDRLELLDANERAAAMARGRADLAEALAGATSVDGVLQAAYVELKARLPSEPVLTVLDLDGAVTRQVPAFTTGEDPVERPADRLRTTAGWQARATIAIAGGTLTIAGARDDAERAAMHDMAVTIASSLERAMAFERERAIARRLQNSLLELNTVTTAAVFATRYRSSDAQLQVGGDWYDIERLSDGRLAASVGDVVGGGLEAAALMGQLRSALSAIALDAGDPADALARLHRFASGTRDLTYATVAHTVIDLDAQQVAFALAGHLPPIVVSPTGEVSFLEGGLNPPLAALTPAPSSGGRAPFAPGSTLVLYTDGLVERRTETIDDGLARLARILGAAWKLPVNRLADELLGASMTTTSMRDDVALLVLRSVTDTGALFVEAVAAGDVETSLGSLARWLTQQHLLGGGVERILGATTDVCSTAFATGRGARDGRLVTIEAAIVDARILVTIVDADRSGPLREVVPSRDPTGYEVTVEPAEHGTIVTITAPAER